MYTYYASAEIKAARRDSRYCGRQPGALLLETSREAPEWDDVSMPRSFRIPLCVLESRQNRSFRPPPLRPGEGPSAALKPAPSFSCPSPSAVEPCCAATPGFSAGALAVRCFMKAPPIRMWRPGRAEVQVQAKKDPGLAIEAARAWRPLSYKTRLFPVRRRLQAAPRSAAVAVEIFVKFRLIHPPEVPLALGARAGGFGGRCYLPQIKVHTRTSSRPPGPWTLH